MNSTFRFVGLLQLARFDGFVNYGRFKCNQCDRFVEIREYSHNFGRDTRIILIFNNNSMVRDRDETMM